MDDAIRIFGMLHNESHSIEGDDSAHGHKPHGEVRPCAKPECRDDGIHKAPRHPRNLSEVVWFCRPHAREHNAKWDYFKDMNRDQIDQFRDDDVTWRRPTWKLSTNSGKPWTDPGFGGDWFDIDGGAGTENSKARARQPSGDNGPAAGALSTLNLDPSATWKEIKARYKVLVKRHHPDANGGSKKAENRLKQIIRAYDILKKCYEQ
jgi:hypothetical protein